MTLGATGGNQWAATACMDQGRASDLQTFGRGTAAEGAERCLQPLGGGKWGSSGMITALGEKLFPVRTWRTEIGRHQLYLEQRF